VQQKDFLESFRVERLHTGRLSCAEFAGSFLTHRRGFVNSGAFANAKSCGTIRLKNSESTGRGCKKTRGRTGDAEMTEQTKLMEETVSSEEIYDGKVVHLYKDVVRLINGKTAVREVIRHVGAVAIVAMTDEGEALMVRQYRYPFGRALLEVPAGKLDPGEPPEDCARRELSEETGAAAETLTYIGDFYPSVAYLDENIRLFVAKGLTFGDAHTDEDEFLNLEKIPLKTLVQMVLRGEIRDGKTQAAILKVWCLENGLS